MSLFDFNDDFIASVSCGMNDHETLELFAESVRAGADVLEQKLFQTVGPEAVKRATFVAGAFEIPMDQDQYDQEFGGAGEPPQPNIRRAIISSQIPGTREMGRMLGDG